MPDEVGEEEEEDEEEEEEEEEENDVDGDNFSGADEEEEEVEVDEVGDREGRQSPMVVPSSNSEMGEGSVEDDTDAALWRGGRRV